MAPAALRVVRVRAPSPVLGRVVLCVVAALSLACEREADRLVALVRAPAMVGSGTTQAVGAVEVSIRLREQRLVGSRLERLVYDVEIENRSGAPAGGCVGVESASTRTALAATVLGRGRLEPGARAVHRRALALLQRRDFPLRVDALRWWEIAAAGCPATPNVVLILADDLGWADVSSFGGMAPATPNIDRLGREGIAFRDFYAAPSCTPARAELMTGSYARRVGMPRFYGPFSTGGLHPDELTIPELLAPFGYRSALVGKWHLGSAPAFRPTAQGFDEFFGVLYSHDLTRAENPLLPSLRLFDGDAVVEVDPDLTTLTRRFTDRAVQFIADNADRPFLLQLAHVMPHVPLAPSAGFAGASGLGAYADVLLEIDDSVGRVLDALRANGVERDTIVLFASDNGPWLRFGNHGGLADPLREGKLTVFEGGVRSPALLRWPSVVAPGRETTGIAGLIDVLPTLADVVAAPLPEDRIIDGQSLVGLLEDPQSAPPRDVHLLHHDGQLQAVRRGRFKLHVPHPYETVATPGADGSAGSVAIATVDAVSLYDLALDPGERTNVADAHPQVVDALLELVDEARLDLGDDVLGLPGAGVRPAGGR